MNRYRLLAGIIVFGSIWGMLECTIGSPGVSSSLGGLPAGAMLAGLFGLGLMVWTRRTYRIPGMQLGMALVAGMLRFVAPIGSCVICSALAIGAEGLVFEFIYSRPSLNINKLKDPATLAFLGIGSGYAIYVIGYVFTQAFTPIMVGQAFVASDLAAAMPLILGRGFFAALFGGVAVPAAVLVKHLHLDVQKIRTEYYYPTASVVSAFCWILVIAIYF